MATIDLALKSILTTFFLNSRCLVVITDTNNEICFQTTLQLLILNVKNGSHFENIFNYAGCRDFLVFTDYAAAIFQQLEYVIQRHPDRFNQRRYVFVTDRSDDFSIFRTKEIQFVSDVLLVTKDGNKTIRNNNINNNDNNTFFNKQVNAIFSFWTHKYVGRDGSTNDVYLIDKWFAGNKSFLFDNQRFPNKLSDQQGRYFKTAVFNYEPYIVVDPLGNGSYLYMGSEMMTMVTFAEYLNMTVVPVINEADYWGNIWENWSGNGLTGNIVKDNADIGAAALYTWEYFYTYLDLSLPSVRAGATSLVPTTKLAAGWLTPVEAFSSKTWITFIITFLIILIILYLVEILHANISGTQHSIAFKINIFTKAISATLKPVIMQNISARDIGSGLIERYLMGLVFMTTLILSVAYDSGLATIMTVPRYENPIDTLENFIARDVYWAGPQDVWLISIKDSKEPNMIELIKRFITTSEEQLRQFSLEGEIGFPVERLPRENYAIPTYVKKDVIHKYRVMAQDFYWSYCVFMLRKNSILLPFLDMFILRVFDAGLIYYWQNEAATEYMDQYVQKAIKYHQKDRGIVKLKMRHVQGAFGILGFGSVLASVIFLMELIIARISNKKK